MDANLAGLSDGVIGGVVTGFFTLCAVIITQKRATKREELNRNYELKRQVYFDFIDQTMIGRRLYEGYQKVEDKQGTQEQREKWRLIEEWFHLFDPAKIKVQVCGSDKIKTLIEPWQSASFGKKDKEKFEKVTNEVIAAMKEDLIRKI